MSDETRYPVRCECGAELSVPSSAAGGQLPCHCGRSVQVPRLSELRRRAGQPPLDLGPLGSVERMLADGHPAPGQLCAFSQVATNDVMMFTILLQKPHVSGGYNWLWLAVIGLWSIPLYLIASRERPEVHGQELRVRVPLRIAAHHQAEVRKLPPWQLRNLISTVPLYACLLHTYPAAEVLL
jgi:hypothetical protein